MMAAGLIALASMVTIPATSASGSPSVTGPYKIVEHYGTHFYTGSVHLYSDGEVCTSLEPLCGDWAYNGVSLVAVFDEYGCDIGVVAEGNPTNGFGGTIGEGPVGACGPAPYGATFTLTKV
jgi:hypothetical protein